jgi:hypothetical protein
MAERELRAELLNTLLTTPHRNLVALRPVHESMIEQDPLFYMHLAAWYADQGTIRDHKEMFVSMLSLSEFEGHRDVGLALLRRLPPYEVARVVDFIKGREVTSERPLSRSRRGRRQEIEIVKERVGLFRNVPRSMKTEITHYLREREANEKNFDRVAMTARKALKRLYAGLHIQPSERAQAILFDDNPPEDSLAFAVKQIAKADTPKEQARAISAYKVPYRVASSLIGEMSPMVVAALIDVMTPQEVINNVGSLKRRGALENPDLKSLIEGKLEKAKTDKRVSAYKAKVAAEAAEVSGDLAETLDEVTERQVKTTGKITRPTALLIDKSGSMEQSIDVGKQLGALVSAICDTELYTYAFDTAAYSIKAKGTSLAEWEKALAGIKAGGGTSCGVAIQRLRKKKQLVEQIIMVTDEGENTPPRFQDTYKDYAKAMNVQPALIIVKIGRAGNLLERVCYDLGVAPNVFEFRGDYYSLPNIIPLLTYPSLTEMVMEILEYPLPERKAS